MKGISKCFVRGKEVDITGKLKTDDSVINIKDLDMDELRTIGDLLEVKDNKKSDLIKKIQNGILESKPEVQAKNEEEVF